jgi:hypothetical protein
MGDLKMQLGSFEEIKVKKVKIHSKIKWIKKGN